MWTTNSDTKYTNTIDMNKHDARDLHKWAQQRAVSGRSFSLVCHTTLAQVRVSFHSIRMLHMCRPPYSLRPPFLLPPCTSPSSSVSPSSCTLTCTPTSTTWTLWKITCATPPRGATTRTTSLFCRSIMHYTSYLRTKDCTNNGYVTDMLEHNTMINIDTGVHMISYITQTWARTLSADH